jgi:hypothetical protein
MSVRITANFIRGYLILVLGKKGVIIFDQAGRGRVERFRV